MNEADFQSRVIDLARLTGWRVHHTRAARKANGKWSSPIQGDVGFPDLVLARDGVVLMVELKSDKGKTTVAQDRWLEALGDHGRLWKPEHWPEIVETLGRLEGPKTGRVIYPQGNRELLTQEDR